MEVDSNKIPNFKHQTLFEGFIYNKLDYPNFLITDILISKGTLVSCNYALRFSLLNEILNNKINLNGHLKIGIHNIFDNPLMSSSLEGKTLLAIFKENFEFGSEINSIEYINDLDFNKIQKVNELNIDENQVVIKRITKGKYIDVYHVFDPDTGNEEGMLYVKTLQDSKYLRTLCFKDTFIDLPCKYNNMFKKYYIKSKN